MQAFDITRIMLVAVVGLGLGGPAVAQTQSGIVKPNSQNLLQGPSSWSRQQRKLNIPGATTNPTMRQPSPAPPQPRQPVPINPPPQSAD